MNSLAVASMRCPRSSTGALASLREVSTALIRLAIARAASTAAFWVTGVVTVMMVAESSSTSCRIVNAAGTIWMETDSVFRIWRAFIG